MIAPDEGWKILVRGQTVHTGNAGVCVRLLEALRREDDPFGGRGGDIALQPPNNGTLFMICWPEHREWK